MKDFFIGCLPFIILIIAVAAFEGWIFMLLWNWLVPMFWTSAPIFNFWQAFGVLILINIIFAPFKKSKS